jgi:flagellar basal body-associated protein FliL
MPEAPLNSALIASAKSAKAGNKNLVSNSVAVLVLGAAGLFFWLRPGPAGSDSHAAGERTLALDSFVVNLDGAGQRAYLRAGITLGLSRALPRKKEDVPVAALRDAILGVLSSARAEQLLASDGKQKLKAALLPALQECAPDLGIENVYFTEFLVQM